jgi:redox-sensitive bicupin YhaK (pirin superfamily)
MIKIRRAEDRGHTKLNWLDSRHTFSFGDYHDPQHMGFSDLRVINEDRVISGAGFPTHSHRDMEIITYVLEGALAHEDSTGTSSVIKPGEVQRMSAGKGISHSEYNASPIEPVHFLQIWIEPSKTGLAPSYEQQVLRFDKDRSGLILIASKDGRNGSVTVHQDIDLLAAQLGSGQRTNFHLKTHRRAWVQIARGGVMLNGMLLKAGDGVAASQEDVLEAKAVEDAELLVFDLA